MTRPDGAATASTATRPGDCSPFGPAGDEFRLEGSPAGRLAAHRPFRGGAHRLRVRVPRRDRAHRRRRRQPRSSSPTTTSSGSSAWWRLVEPSGTSTTVVPGCCRWSTTPPAGAWSYDHDAEGRLRTADRPARATDPPTHDAAGRLAEVVDPTGDAARDTRTTPSAGSTVPRRPTAPRPPTPATNGAGCPSPPARRRRATPTSYTPAGRVRSIATAEGRTGTYVYDAAGRLVAVRDPAGATTPFAWDVCDRLARPLTRRPDRPRGPRPRRTRRAVHTRRANEPIPPRPHRSGPSLTDALGATTRYRYDGRGLLTSATDPLGNAVRLRYDDRGRGRRRPRPPRRAHHHDRDAMRRPVAITDQLGPGHARPRDAAGRVVRRDLPTGAGSNGSATPRSGHRRPGRRA